MSARSTSRLVLAAALLLVGSPRPALATSGGCARVPDGSPCRTDCVVDGICMGGVCLGGSPVPDGTACATGFICTSGDTCLQGICHAGNQVVCANGPCGPAVCVEGVGCSPIAPCDMARPVDLAGADLISSPDLAPPRDGLDPLPDLVDPLAPDGGVPLDGGAMVIDANSDTPVDAALGSDDSQIGSDDLAPRPDDLARPDGGLVADMAVVVPDGDLPDGELRDGELPADDLADVDAAPTPDDADLPDGDSPGGETDDAGEGLPIHVHGSGCALSDRGAPTGLAGLALLLVAVAMRRRARH